MDMIMKGLGRIKKSCRKYDAAGSAFRRGSKKRLDKGFK
jgi:hypothetical protein